MESSSDRPALSAPLTDDELLRMVDRVFRPRPEQRRLLIITDLPDRTLGDHEPWSVRRAIALDWARRLSGATDAPYQVDLLLYRNVRANNADLPSTGWLHPLKQELPPSAEAAETAEAGSTPTVSLSDVFARTDLVLAPTELSTTAPLKIAAKQHRFSAATMPGFGPAMVPALRLDYGEIDRRVRALACRLDRATGASIRFRVDDREDETLFLDLRHRTAHASGGLLREVGSAGNLPSGEAYIVPYEGEHSGDPSRSQGILPVQLGNDVVRYQITANRAVDATGDEPTAPAERQRLADEPAYGNLAELGLGVLAAFGVEPIGTVLLDEKLGPHIAFGRSDHFGGQVGPGDFSHPDQVVHIDRVYLPETQPRVILTAIDLEGEQGTTPLWRDGDYVAGAFDV